ncbi:MAG: TM1802 family CRISPR-associated protein, partial [Elusimicrobiales bacterium]|nr:TM1802 family CRISPR-associated protein [Elusimicrobiales bacterium]
LLFSNIMKKIRKKFIENELNLDVLSSFSIYLFLSELNLIKNPNKGNHGGEIMMDKLDEFLKQNKITNPEHKAVFSLGILCEKLLNIQYSIRGSKPFIKNLKGLKMKEHDFKALFPKIQNKLYEYNANYFKELEETISNYFIEAGSNWKTNFEELNFYFVLGMNLANKIMKENKEEK